MNNLLKSRQVSIALALLAVLMLASCGQNTSAPNAGSTNATPATTPVTSGSNTDTSTTGGTTASVPADAAKLGAKPTGETTCPSNAPIKGKITQKRGNIYHVAKSLDYAKVKPDICFQDTATAEKAGFKLPS